MYTFKEVVAKLGDAQVSGGRIVVLRAGRHVDIGRVASESGVFVLTPEGLKLLNAIVEPAPVEPSVEPAPAEAPKETAAQRKAREKAEKAALLAAKTAAADDLSDLGDDFDE